MRSRSGRQTHSDRLVEDEAQGALRPSCPAEEAINLNRQTGVQRPKRSTSTRRTGVQREKGLSLQPPDWTEDEGPWSTPSFRSALPAKDQRQLRSGSISLVGDRGRANHPPVRPVQQGSRTQGFYGRKPWKKPNSEASIAAPRPAKEGLRPPFRKPPPHRSQKLPANPPHARPGYRHNRPQLSLFRSSRFPSALRVSKSAVLRQLAWPSRSNPRSGRFSGGSVIRGLRAGPAPPPADAPPQPASPGPSPRWGGRPSAPATRR